MVIIRYIRNPAEREREQERETDNLRLQECSFRSVERANKFYIMVYYIMSDLEILLSYARADLISSSGRKRIA